MKNTSFLHGLRNAALPALAMWAIIAAVALLCTGYATPALAQIAVGTYSEQNGNVKNQTSTVVGDNQAPWNWNTGRTGAFSNTTGQSIITAVPSATVRPYVDHCTVQTTAFGTASTLEIRDDTNGATLWVISVPTTGILVPIVFNFETPLKGVLNKNLTMQTFVANTTGTAWVTCTGHYAP